MEQQVDSRQLVRDLVERIENANFTLHWSGGWPHQCKRVVKGLSFSSPEDCTCGLDQLLEEARKVAGDDQLGRHEPPVRQVRTRKPW
jgi:hypothetical protein